MSKQRRKTSRMLELFMWLRLKMLALVLRHAGDRLRPRIARWVRPLMEGFIRQAVRADSEAQPVLLLPGAPLFRFKDDAMIFAQLLWQRDDDALMEFIAPRAARKTLTIWEKEGISVAFLTEKCDRDAPTAPKQIIIDDNPIGAVWTPGTYLLVIQPGGE
jgi:hypothetical protein